MWDWLKASQWERMIELDATYEEMAAFIIFIVILWLSLPINKICACCGCDKQANQEEEMALDEVTYLERLPFFTDCYDTTNPLTQREGRLRMIQAEIDRAGDDPEKVEALKQQQEAVSSQDRMQALQAYSMAAQARAAAYQA